MVWNHATWHKIEDQKIVEISKNWNVTKGNWCNFIKSLLQEETHRHFYKCVCVQIDQPFRSLSIEQNRIDVRARPTFNTMKCWEKDPIVKIATTTAIEPFSKWIGAKHKSHLICRMQTNLFPIQSKERRRRASISGKNQQMPLFVHLHLDINGDPVLLFFS